MVIETCLGFGLDWEICVERKLNVVKLDRALYRNVILKIMNMFSEKYDNRQVSLPRPQFLWELSHMEAMENTISPFGEEYSFVVWCKACNAMHETWGAPHLSHVARCWCCKSTSFMEESIDVSWSKSNAFHFLNHFVTSLHLCFKIYTLIHIYKGDVYGFICFVAGVASNLSHKFWVWQATHPTETWGILDVHIDQI